MLTEQDSSPAFALDDPPCRLAIRRQITEQYDPLIVLPHLQLDAFFDVAGESIIDSRRMFDRASYQTLMYEVATG
jgi:hypothetical protein